MGQHHQRAAHIVERRFKTVVEQRQPVVHAGMMTAKADRLVQRIVGSRTELRHVSCAEAADGVPVERHLAGRQQFDIGNLVGGELRLRIEAADRVERRAEEIEAVGFVRARRPEIDDAAAQREITRLAHGAAAHITVAGEKPHQPVVIHIVADAGMKLRFEYRGARRHALQHRIDRSDNHRGAIVRLAPRQCRERRQPRRFDVRLG